MRMFPGFKDKLLHLVKISVCAWNQYPPLNLGSGLFRMGGLMGQAGQSFWLLFQFS